MKRQEKQQRFFPRGTYHRYCYYGNLSWLIKYIEKTNVSSDTQLCDSVKTAITTAMMDPTVLEEAASVTQINGFSANTSVTSIGTSTRFGRAVEEALGMPVAQVNGKLKSWNSATADVKFTIVSSNSVHVTIPNSDSRGAKGQSDKVTGAYSAARDAIYVD